MQETPHTKAEAITTLLSVIDKRNEDDLQSHSQNSEEKDLHELNSPCVKEDWDQELKSDQKH